MPWTSQLDIASQVSIPTVPHTLKHSKRSVLQLCKCSWSIGHQKICFYFVPYFAPVYAHANLIQHRNRHGKSTCSRSPGMSSFFTSRFVQCFLGVFWQGETVTQLHMYQMSSKGKALERSTFPPFIPCPHAQQLYAHFHTHEEGWLA